MSLTLELPRPLDRELSEEAEREGVPPAEHAILLLYLAHALSSEDRQTPFKEAVRAFLTRRSLDADHVTSVFEELVRVCLVLDEGKSALLPQDTSDAVDDQELELLTRWRNAMVHGVGVGSEAISPSLSTPAQRQQERDPELAARVRSIRGKFAHAGGALASDELHRERQSDKEAEERQVHGNGS